MHSEGECRSSIQNYEIWMLHSVTVINTSRHMAYIYIYIHVHFEMVMGERSGVAWP